MTSIKNRRGEGKVLQEKIKGVRIAMLTTMDEVTGVMHSRPMITQDDGFDGDLWFLTRASAPKVGEAIQHQVNVSYASPDDNRYVSVSGVAELVRDRQKIESMWKAAHNIWFPNGKDDPDLALLKITVTNAEYWDGPANKMIQIFQAASAWNTGKPALGEHEKLQLS